MSSPYSGPPPWQQPDPAQPTYPPPGYPPPGYPPPGYPGSQPLTDESKDSVSAAPRALRPVVALLLINLALSVLLTIVTLIARHSVVDYQLDHRHITDPQQRALLRDTYSYGILVRVVTNIIISVVYVFLVRALLRGRRWAYRRVILLGALGIAGLVILQATPYPAWMRVEQLLQALVLAGLLYFVLRPEVKAYFDPRLPGRTGRRFQR